MYVLFVVKQLYIESFRVFGAHFWYFMVLDIPFYRHITFRTPKALLSINVKAFNTMKVPFIFFLLFCGQNKVLSLGYHTSFQHRSNIIVFLVTREMALLS